MAKQSSEYVCNECGAKSPKWLGKCPVCGTWGSLVEEIITPLSPTASPAITLSAAKPVPVTQIPNERLSRFSTGIGELDRVLGGGLVEGSFVLIGGEPGVGKSTLLTQVAGNLSKTRRVLYASAEENCTQIKLRAQRLNIAQENLHLLNETDLSRILAAAEGYSLLIVDSIQAVYLPEMNSSAGSVGQVRECASRLMRHAKSTGTTVLLVGQVTKDGSLAGPKVLEHMTDTVLSFEGEETGECKILRCAKNRFGNTLETGVFFMRQEGLLGVEDFAQIFLSPTRGTEPGAIVTPYLSGNRCMPVEVQSLVAKSLYGMPRRMPLGVDHNRLILLLAVLEKRAALPLYTADVYVSALGGIRLDEPAADLAILLSVASAATGLPVQGNVAAFGEVGLTGEIRPVRFLESRILECKKQGLTKIILPKGNYRAALPFAEGLTLIPVSYISQAVKYLTQSQQDAPPKPQKSL